MAEKILDPTENVMKLVEAAVKRQDDLRIAESRRVNDLMELRATYETKLQLAESRRIDAIRAVDVGAVAIADERATAQAAVLANQVSQSAETLRNLVATTAQGVAKSLEQMSTQLTERIALLEKSQYQISGTGTGRKDVWGWVVAAILAAISIAGYLHK